MDEYIKREALLADIDAAMEKAGMGYVIGQTMKRYIKRQPAADVVEVVRCGECKFIDDKCAHGIVCVCDHGGMCGTFVADTDFCSYGKRRTE